MLVVAMIIQQEVDIIRVINWMRPQGNIMCQKLQIDICQKGKTENGKNFQRNEKNARVGGFFQVGSSYPKQS